MSGKRVPLIDVALDLSDIADHIDPLLADHHRRVAPLAAMLGERSGLDGDDLRQVVLAGAIHDVGAVTLEERLKTLRFDVELYEHAEPGYLLLRDCPLFAGAAEIIRFHHLEWPLCAQLDPRTRLLAQVLQIADRLSIVAFLHRAQPRRVQRMRDDLSALRGARLCPDLLDPVLHAEDDDPLWVEATAERPSPVSSEGWPLIGGEEMADIAWLLARLIDFRSRFTAAHSFAVAEVSERLGALCGLPAAQLPELRAAGYLHDLGKLAVPREVIEKPEQLTAEDWEAMRVHPEHSWGMLAKLEGMERIAAWAANHHERLDGSGYPRRLKAAEIDLGSRIVAVADVYVALAEERPYRAGCSTAKIHDALQAMAAQGLDPKVVATLLTHYREIDAARRSADARVLLEFNEFDAALMVDRLGGGLTGTAS